MRTLSLLAACFTTSIAFAQPASSTRWLRVIENEQSQTLSLEVASRPYTAPSGQTVTLVGAIHVGDHSYYSALQNDLDSSDLVLWEGVKPAAILAADSSLSDTQRAQHTSTRIRLLAAIVERHRTRTKKYPASLDEVAAAATPQQKTLIQTLQTDAWGHPLHLIYGSAPSKNPKAPPGQMVKVLDIVSDGADGKPGGEGPAADLHFTTQPPLSAAEKTGKDAGIQTQLANALGLEFQLNAINYDHPTWRNCDMSAEALQQRMEEKGQSLEPLMGMLDGSSAMGAVAGILLRMIGSSPAMQTNVKCMMVHMLGSSEDLEGLSGAAGMGDIMKVIVEDRNQVVLADLQKVLTTEPKNKTIAIFYGAGHFPGMEKSLITDFHMTPGELHWTPAITIDLKAAGITMAQARQYKEVIRGMTDAARNKTP